MTAGVILCAVLSACSAESNQPLTLAQSKSPVQLLRNEAAGRVPADVVERVIREQDGSTACRTPETDPEGLLRSWRSIIRFELRRDASVDPQGVVDGLATSFVDDGWSQGTFGVASIVELTRPNSETQIHLSMKLPDEGAEAGGEVQLAVSGPCVMTLGAESSEVTQLGEVVD